MIVKVFESNNNGKIEFTRCELEKLLNEIYKKGYDTGTLDAKHNTWTWTSPNLTSPVLYRDSVITNETVNPIDNLSCAVDVKTTPVTSMTSSTVKVENPKTSVRSATPNTITLEMKDLDKVTLAKSIDDIFNALLEGNVYNAPKKPEDNTPNGKLAKELRGL